MEEKEPSPSRTKHLHDRTPVDALMDDGIHPRNTNEPKAPSLRGKAWPLLLAILLLLSGCKGTSGAALSRPPSAFITDLAAYTVKLTVTCPTGDGSEGSGVLISPEGHLLTAYHVVEQAVRNPRCQIVVGRSKKLNSSPLPLYRAHIVLTDAPMDIAVLHIYGDRNERPLDITFRAAPLAEHTPPVGATVHVLGYPGITDDLLAYDKDTIIAEGECGAPETCWLLTEAFASWGSSGGPVFNDNGELIGLAVGEKKMAWKGRAHRLTTIRPLPPFSDFITRALALPTAPTAHSGTPAAVIPRVDAWELKIVGPLGVNWRTEPSTAKGKATVIRVLPTGATLHVIPPGNWRGWWATADDRGHMGWVKERTERLVLAEPHLTTTSSLLHEGDEAVVTCLTRSPCATLIYTPGYRSEGGDAVIGHLGGGTHVTVLEGPEWVENRIWWRVRGDDLDGWLEEITDKGYRLLAPTKP